jgi:hypothetical protein
MALQFTIPKGIEPRTAKTLVAGFGLPMVQRALIGSINTNETDPKKGTSRFGTPIYSPFLFKKPKEGEWVEYTYNQNTGDYTKNDFGQNISTNFNDVGCLIKNCIIEVSQQKTIITTEVSGLATGSVKEFINNGDYQITLRGFFDTEYPDSYPQEDVEVLREYLRVTNSLEFECDFLFMLINPFINRVVVTSYNFFQQQGLRNVQYFEITMITDFNYDIVKV